MFLIFLKEETSVIIFLTRKRLTLQAVIFCVLCKPFIYNLNITWFIIRLLSVATISATERANQWLAANYKLYSKQQYFDSQGMFISLAFSAPVLLNCVAVLINWFLKSGDLLVNVKRKELEERAKKTQ